MKQSYDLDLFYNMLITYLDDLETDTDFPAYFYQGLYDGTSKLKSLTVTETKKFDDYWIAAIEAYYPSIDKIARNYKSALRIEEDVVVIEKAKRTNSRTVRHLAANTHLLKEREQGDKSKDILPTKLLVQESDIEYGIYENRFVKTLIQRLAKFVAERVKILREDVDTKRYHNVDSNIEFKIESSTYKVNIGLEEVESISTGKIEQENYMLLKRAEDLDRKIGSLLNSVFMKTLRTSKPVKPPILKTQIILKNIDYRNCYLLWQYLDQYSSLGFELIREEKQKRFNESYRKHLSQNSLMAFSTFMFHDKFREKNAQLDMKRFKVKKAEILRVNPEDLITDPKEYQIEDTKINEYYLNKNKQIFKKMIDSYIETEPKYEVALKKALKDTIEITNSLYQSYFEVNTDDDMFARLIQTTHPRENLAAADEKFKIAETIRQVKEQDYKQAIALEKKWYQSVLNYQKQFFKWVQEENADFLKKETEKVRKANNQYIKLERKKVLEELKLQVATDNQKLLDLKIKYRDTYKKEASRIAEAQRLRAERERERLIKQRDLAKAKLDKAKLQQKTKQDAFVKKQREKIQTSHKKAMESLKKGK